MELTKTPPLPPTTRILIDMLIGYFYNAYQLGVPLGVQWTPSPTNPVHWLVVGPSGTGKTVFSASLVARIALHVPDTKIWVASYKDDDFFQFCHGIEGARYRFFNDSVSAIQEFKDILDARLGGDPDRSFRLLWVDELAAMVTGLPRAESTFVKDAISSTLQTGRSLNCQILVSVQRGDSAYFNNGSKENFGNLVFLGPHISKESAAMFGVDRATLSPVTGRAGYYIINGNTEAIQPIQVPIIKDTTKLKAALLNGITQ